MANKEEVKQRCAELLGITPIGQALQSQHDERMGEAFDEVYAELEGLNVATWTITAEMPDEVTPHFVGLMAYNKADQYGISDSRYARLINRIGQNGERAKAAIKAHVRGEYNDYSNPTDY